MNTSPHPSEHELVTRVEHQRDQLMEAADVLRKPVQTVNRAERAIRRALPVLPYAIAAIAVASIVGTLLRGRRVRPALLLATGLDLWRVWKSLQASQAVPRAGALTHQGGNR